MNDNATIPDVIQSDRYHEFVPTTALLITGKDYWDGLSLNIYHYSAADNEGIMTPSIPDYAIVFILSGSGEGNCHFGNYKWKNIVSNMVSQLWLKNITRCAGNGAPIK
jgi:hypothetical protein